MDVGFAIFVLHQSKRESKNQNVMLSPDGAQDDRSVAAEIVLGSFL